MMGVLGFLLFLLHAEKKNSKKCKKNLAFIRQGFRVRNIATDLKSMCYTSRQASLNITKYNKTRNWAVWNNGELLAVTVYRKGAQAVCDFINNLTPYNTKMNKKANKAAKATQTEQEIIILVETKPNGQRMRASLSRESTSVCYDTKGAWHEDASYSQPLTELMEQGLLKPANQRARQAIRDFFGEVAKPAAKKEAKSKPAKAKKHAKAKAKGKAKEAEIIILPTDEPAKVEEAQEAEIIMVVATATMTKMRATLEANRTEICESVKGAWTTDEVINRPLSHLVANGAYELANKHSRTVYRRFYGEGVADTAIQAEAVEHEAAEEVKQERAEAQATPSARKLICAVVMQGETELRPIPADIVLKPGMKLIREYKGTTYMVDVKENGFEWDGEVYPTLTHISWKVTPYKQGGPAFFGIPAKPRAMKA